MLKSESYNIADSRNYGFWNEAEQSALGHAKVAIAGAGGDGFQLGYKLAMMGVGEISVADPEAFEPENSNRVLAATRDNCGRNKAEVFREMASALPRDIKINVFTDGVTEDNVDEFMDGANLVLDESELTYLNIGTMIARKAIEKAIPELLVMNIGFAGIATSFAPNEKSKGFQELMGIDKNTSLDEVADMEVDYSRCVPYIPAYGDYDTFKAVVFDGASLPSISQGVDIASAIGSTEAFLHLSGADNHRRQPTWSPRFRFMDAYTNKSGIIRYPRLAHYGGVTRLYVKNKMSLNPKASYSSEDRARRAQAN